MTTRMLRRGLPRVPGGEPWPPADAAGIDETVDVEMLAAPAAASAAPEPSPAAAPATTPAPVATTAEAVASTSTTTTTTTEPVPSPASAGESGATGMRRGLPRVAGGEPWPPARLSSASGGKAPSSVATAEVASAQVPAAPAAHAAAVSASAAPATTASPAPTTAAPAAQYAPPNETTVRRGLPRVAGGEPWPPAGTRPVQAADPGAASTAPAVAADADTALPEPAAASTRSVASEPAATASRDLIPAAAPAAILTPDIGTPLPWSRTVWNGRAPRHVTATPASGRLRPTWTQAIAGLLSAAGLGIAAAAGVAFVRALLSLPFMQDFLVAFPGEYHPAIDVAAGFAPWVGWQHFFNAFLIVLIIRSGLRVRTEKRPTVFWTPRGNNKGKISLTLWFHQALDILWLVNGLIFIVLIFATGHWVRIVPTSWEVLPNALSAALQYVSLDWPTENGWVNYNSLQQLAYFATVFIAAPLAAITGFRMSGMWPKSAEKLSRAYPVEWARALHFPVMLYFVAFIVVHVALVMFTGFLRNLNHMYASQDAVTWTGFWVFTASVVVMIAVWVAARPLVLAPIAKLFGSVSGR